MNWFKNLFKKEESVNIDTNVDTTVDTNTTPVFNNTTEEYDWLFVEAVIKNLKNKPENFSARWFRNTMEDSIMSMNGNILFMIDSCHFVNPKRINPNNEQVKQMKELIKPIIKRDNDYVLKKIIGELD